MNPYSLSLISYQPQKIANRGITISEMSVMHGEILSTGTICCDPRSGINKYSPTNERKIRVKNPRWRSHRGFFTRIFLEFGVNIWDSAERSSAYCHYSMFFGRHNQYPSLVMNTVKYSTLFLVLWRRKTWNNANMSCFAQWTLQYSIRITFGANSELSITGAWPGDERSQRPRYNWALLTSRNIY